MPQHDRKSAGIETQPDSAAATKHAQGEGLATSNDRNSRALIKELAGAVSTQAQIANRTWLALMTVAFFAVLPRVQKDGSLTFPFGFGSADPVVYYITIYSILVILAIAFASAHAQQMRAQHLAQIEIDSIPISKPMKGYLHPRELFDMLRMPSFNRVAPLAQLLRGKYQFYKTGHDCPAWLRLGTIIYYVLLKVVSLAVYFGLPPIAMWRAYVNVSSIGFATYTWTARVGGAVACFALIVVFVAEIWYAHKITKFLWKPHIT